MIALSIRQPWAWLIVHGHKLVENRTWETPYRGPVLVHAGKVMTKAEYQECVDYAELLGITCIPPADELERGGFVGRTSIYDCVSDADIRFFEGPFGFLLREEEARFLPFVPYKGHLGFFNVKPEVFQAPGLEGYL